VANTGTEFVLSNGTVKPPAAFIFATLDGHIEAWSHKVDRLIGDAEGRARDCPSARGRVAGSLLIGNFGDGRINIIANAAITTLRRRTHEDRHHRPWKRWRRPGRAVAQGRA